MRKIHTQALAKQDLKNIWLYSFKKWGAEQADCYFDELNAAFALITEKPELGFACDYIREGYRQFHINRHLVFIVLQQSKFTLCECYDSMSYTAHL